MWTISTNDYFRVDLQDHLPESETHRRRLIKERLEEQYEAWQDQEKQRRYSDSWRDGRSADQYGCSTEWLAITQPNTVAFLGLDWTSMLPFLRKYVEDNSISFALVSELQLSTIRPALVRSIQSHPDYSGLYELYRRYAICIYDFGNPVEEYRVPIIDAVAAPRKNSILFEYADSDLVSNWLPLRTSTFRVLVFPQTRYSFIDDEVVLSFMLQDLSDNFRVDISSAISLTRGRSQGYV